MYVVYDRLRVQLHNKTITQVIANQGSWSCCCDTFYPSTQLALCCRNTNLSIILIDLCYICSLEGVCSELKLSSFCHRTHSNFTTTKHHHHLSTTHVYHSSIAVLSDISKIMFNKDFVGEMFRPQDVYKPDVLRALFDKLVNASIMRINHESFDKVVR